MRRIAPRTIFVALLAAEIIASLAIARWTPPARPGDPIPAIYSQVFGATTSQSWEAPLPFESLGWVGYPPIAGATPTASAPTAVPAAAPAPTPAPTPAPHRAVTAAPVYSGRNHLWIPSLGVNRSVTFFSCDRSTPPGDYVYRWGCAGTNNVFLFGHAESVFKPLHDAYATGRLKVGMAVIYADSAGHVHTYRVTTWRLVTPDQVDWAIAAQSKPSMTLQTCYGANSQYRLLVRLVQSA